MAAPTDITGHHIFQASNSPVSFPFQDAPAKSLQEWVQQLPAAEKRLISAASFAICDAEHLLLQYLQIECCTIHIGTSGEHKYHWGAFAWIICSPGREHLNLSTGPVNGWHKRQSSLRSATTALESVTLYLDEPVTFYSLIIRCKFKVYADSSSVICNVATIRDLIPKRKVADNADILSTMQAATEVISRYQPFLPRATTPPGYHLNLINFPLLCAVDCHMYQIGNTSADKPRRH